MRFASDGEGSSWAFMGAAMAGGLAWTVVSMPQWAPSNEASPEAQP